jgi:hypothetical protein
VEHFFATIIMLAFRNVERGLTSPRVGKESLMEFCFVLFFCFFVLNFLL